MLCARARTRARVPLFVLERVMVGVNVARMLCVPPIAYPYIDDTGGGILFMRSPRCERARRCLPILPHILFSDFGVPRGGVSMFFFFFSETFRAQHTANTDVLDASEAKNCSIYAVFFHGSKSNGICSVFETSPIAKTLVSTRF